MNQEDFANRLFSMMYDRYSNIGDTINKYYNQAGSQLYGQEQRDVGAAGQQGYAQGASLNLSNPLSLMQRYMSNVQGQYAPQFGNLQTQRVGAQLQYPQQLLQMMMGLMGGFQKPFNFSQDVLPGLVQAGAKAGAALI